MPKSTFSFVDLYENKSRLKWVVLGVALLIAIASIAYTNKLVSELKEREEKLIRLYASTIEYTANYAFQENMMFLFQEVVVTNNSIPVILTDSDGEPLYYRNLPMDSTRGLAHVHERLRREVQTMKAVHEPILISLILDADTQETVFQYVYYKDSYLLRNLRYYPYVQLSIISVFVALAYLAFSYSRTAEQNRIWVGLAKETAHQLGTPISSLMAWIDYLKADPKADLSEISEELDKDARKLEMITQRFSSIGSQPSLQEENIVSAITNTVAYLRPRISSKVSIHIESPAEEILVPLNKALFDWVIENLCKNAVDAMSGIGKIDISIVEDHPLWITIDVTDNGKGIPGNKIKEVFKPGFTTKKRGWGLGLTLVKRIIENYHRGRIFVKSSQEHVGTSFRIMLRKQMS
jgi:signal transduction histidine kinase